MNRRDLLKISALGLIGNNWVYGGSERAEKSCLLIYLHGGLSGQETLFCRPDQPSEYRSVTGEINCGDFYLGGSFPELAKRFKDITPVRSLTSKDSNHGSAASNILTSIPNLTLKEGEPLVEPCYGSLISNKFGQRTANGIPTYTKVNKIEFGPGGRRDGSGWISKEHEGFDVDEENISTLRPNSDITRISSRMGLAAALDRDKGQWASLREEAYGVISGGAAEAFDLSKEPVEVQSRFKVGKSQFGKSLLTAKRLIERGSRWVSLANYGWDNHQEIAQKFKKDGPELDWGLALIIDELRKIGKLDSTLIVITSEFSRTPRLNKGITQEGTFPAGRDHWSRLVPLIFAGGGLDHGPIGECNKLGEYPTESPFTPEDLGWTIGNYFDMPKNLTLYDNLKRPRFIFKEDAKDIFSG